MEKILQISLKLHFTPNTLDWYGLTNFKKHKKNITIKYGRGY